MYNAYNKNDLRSTMDYFTLVAVLRSTRMRIKKLNRKGAALDIAAEPSAQDA